MKRIASVLVVIALSATPSLFAQGSVVKGRHFVQPVSTNLTVSGTLTLLTGVVPVATGTNRHIVAMYTTNQAPGTVKGVNRITDYILDEADGARVIIPETVADAFPVKLIDYLNESVTIVGMGTVSGEGLYRRTHMTKITGVTRDAASGQPAALHSATVPQPVNTQPAAARQLASKAESKDVTVSGTLTMQIVAAPNVRPEANKSRELMTVYILTTSDGAKAIIESKVADAAPVRLRDYFNESVTIVGTGTESGNMKYKRVNIDKITSITRNGAGSQPAVLARTNSSITQTNNNKGYHWEKPITTNLTVSGILTMKIGTDVGNAIVSASRNMSGEKIIMYRLIMADGTRIGFGRYVADAAPVKLDDYIDKSVTIVGVGSIRGGKSGKAINFDKITSITTNAVASQPAGAP